MPEVLEDLAVPQRIDAKDPEALHVLEEVPVEVPNLSQQGHLLDCLLYTSDAADE